jgi:hypothetical protein
MKKRYFVLLFVVAFAAFFWALVQRAGAPLSEKPSGVETAADVDATFPVNKAAKDDLIIVDMPLPDGEVGSPITVRGKARGTWFFEGSFPVTLTDWSGTVLTQGYATAEGEWMTTEYVPFTATITYELPAETPYSYGYLILRKDNPSGEPQFDDMLEFKVNLN